MKQSIQSSQGHAAENQKLIFSGKILSDEKTMGEYEIKEKDFLVVMVSKPKVKKPADAPAAESPAKETASSAAPAAATTAATEEAKPPTAPADASESAPEKTSTPAAPSTPAATESLQASSFLAGSELETAMNSIVEMGFPRHDVQRAMRMSFNNPDRAVEYLMNGLPEEPAPSRPTAVAPGTPATPSPAPAPSTGSVPPPRSGNLFEQAAAMQGGAGAQEGESLFPEDSQGRQVIDFGSPQTLQQLRTLLEQNPAALQPLIQALVQSNPQLAEAISQDPEGVLRMLAGEGLEGEDALDIPTLQQLGEEDRTQVEQMISMGIPESKAIESFFMCGRNLEMAVQYYFEVRELRLTGEPTRL